MLTTLLCVLLCRQDDEFVGRMVRELSSDRPGRAGVARAALLSYGGAALEALKKAGTEPALALADEIRWPDEDVRAMFVRLRGTKVTVDLRDERLSACARRILEGLDLMYGFDNDLGGAHEPRVSLKLEGVTADVALERLAAAAGVHAVEERGHLVFRPRPGPHAIESRVPLRFAGASRAGLKERIAALAAESLDGREAAEAALLEAGLAAEEALWAAIDSPDRDLASRAADVARRLYTVPEVEMQPVPAIGDLSSAGFTDLVKMLAAGSPYVVGPGIECGEGKGVDLLVEMTRRIDWVDVGGTLVAGRRDVIVRTRRARGPVLWLDPSAAALSPLVARVVKGEDIAPEAFATFGPAGVEALRYAERVTEGAARERCGKLAGRLVRETFAERWFADERCALVEDARVTLTAASEPLTDVLKRLTAQSGVAITAERRGDERVSLRVQDAPLGQVLEMLARPCGMTATRSGKTIVLK